MSDLAPKLQSSHSRGDKAQTGSRYISNFDYKYNLYLQKSVTLNTLS